MNLVDVKLFGEMESGFSTIKVVAIILLVVIGFGMAIFHFPVDGGGTASFSNLFNQGGFFPTGIKGFVMSFQMVIFAFVGIEMVGITAGETSDPEINLPKAINSLPIRIGLFYVGSMIAIMSVYPWDKITTTASPFVQVFSGIGIRGAAGILNFVVLTAALSATNSCLFSTSRTLYSLSLKGNAPKKFNIIGKNGVPIWTLIFSATALLIIVVLNFFIPSNVFGIIATVSTINFIIIWMILIFCHLIYRKKHPEGVKAYLMPLYPYSNYLSLLFFGSILVLLLFLKSTRIPMIVTIIFWLLMLVIYRRKTAK